MKRLTTLAGLAVAALLGVFAFAAPASATPTCTTYNDGSPSGTYPADSAGHMQVCFAATSSDKQAIATAVRQLPRKGSSGPLQAYDQVAAAGDKIFFFANRADAVSYLQNTAPYNSYPPYATAANSGKCGFTSSQADGSGMITGIYKTCSYDGVTPSSGTNPDLNHTTKHEMGHAFDLAMGIINGGTVPSAKTGFSGSQNPPNYLLDGVNKLTPQGWSGMTSTQKATVVCGIFSNIKFSPLERSLIVAAGGTDPDPTNVGKSVCVTSGSTMIIDTPYIGKTPTQIAQTIAPYFVNNSSEAWAEIFAVNVGVSTPPAPGFLQLTDRLFINTRYTCANLDVAEYSTTSLPPTQADINLHSCSFTPFDL